MYKTIDKIDGLINYLSSVCVLIENECSQIIKINDKPEWSSYLIKIMKREKEEFNYIFDILTEVKKELEANNVSI